MDGPVDGGATPWGRWALFAGLSAFALWNAVDYVREAHRPPKVEIGAAAPDVTAPRVGGGVVRLVPEAGEVVLLDFWATWCAPCVRSMPELAEVGRRLADRPFRLVLVNQDFSTDDRESVVRDFVKEHGVAALPVALDRGAAAEAWGVRRLPHTVIIDGRGTVRHQWTGASDPDTMAGLVTALLAE